MNQLAKRPFALLGFHGNAYEPQQLKQVMQKEQLNWRSFAGDRATAAKWSARGTPTYYVIDQNGVIQRKWIGYPGAKAIDTALEELITEAER